MAIGLKRPRDRQTEREKKRQQSETERQRQAGRQTQREIGTVRGRDNEKAHTKHTSTCAM